MLKGPNGETFLQNTVFGQLTARHPRKEMEKSVQTYNKPSLITQLLVSGSAISLWTPWSGWRVVVTVTGLHAGIGEEKVTKLIQHANVQQDSHIITNFQRLGCCIVSGVRTRRHPAPSVVAYSKSSVLQSKTA